MRLNWLKAIADNRGPFVTVSLDASRLEPAGAREVELRWQGQERRLLDHGAPKAAVRAAGEAVQERTGHGGPVGKVVVAVADGVVLDLVVPEAPVRDESVHGPAPHLMPVVRGLARSATYALARVDRAGADIEVIGLLGESTEQEQVQGDQDVLHKVPGGGWAQRRYQARVEDSWQRNAAEVARELDRVVRRHRPQLVLLAGDDQAISLLLDHAGHELGTRAVRLDTGGRAGGTSEEAVQRAIRKAVCAHLRGARAELLERFGGALSRQQEAVQGLDAVVDALRRGQVDELLVHDDPSSTATLWVGSEPLQLGSTAEEAREAGAEDPQQGRADAILLWALLASDGGVTLLDPEETELTDGIGALLRWSDTSTPHPRAPSMPGHGEPPGQGSTD